MRSITIERDYSYKLRKAVESVEAVVKTGKPKNIWLYQISKKLKRKKKILPIYTTKGQLEIFDNA